MSQILPKRFWDKVEITDSCWLWTGAVSQGYGSFNLGGRKTIAAYRLSYEYHKGVVPSGLQLDHICRNRLCVNPNHLDPVSQRVNVLRGDAPPARNARKTMCSNGHKFTLMNTYRRKDGGRKCRVCIKAYNKRRRELACRKN